MKFIIAMLAFIFVMVSLTRADDLNVQVGDSVYSREVPADLQEAQQLLRGLTGVLNEVIDAYEKDSSLAQAQVEAILASEDIVAAKIDRAQKTVVKIGPQALAKVFALGLFIDVNPAPGIGGLHLAAGPQAIYNVFNWVLVEARAGISIDQAHASGAVPDFRFDAGIGASFWLF